MGGLPMFESRVCFHTCRQHPHPGTTGAGSESLPTIEGEPQGFHEDPAVGRASLAENPWLSNVKEVEEGEQRQAV